MSRPGSPFYGRLAVAQAILLHLGSTAAVALERANCKWSRCSRRTRRGLKRLVAAKQAALHPQFLLLSHPLVLLI